MIIPSLSNSAVFRATFSIHGLEGNRDPSAFDTLLVKWITEHRHLRQI